MKVAISTKPKTIKTQIPKGDLDAIVCSLCEEDIEDVEEDE